MRERSQGMRDTASHQRAPTPPATTPERVWLPASDTVLSDQEILNHSPADQMFLG